MTLTFKLLCVATELFCITDSFRISTHVLTYNQITAVELKICNEVFISELISLEIGCVKYGGVKL